MATKRGSISTPSKPRLYLGRYRTLAPKPRVDETLFGIPKLVPRESITLTRAEFEVITSATRLPNKDGGQALSQVSERDEEERKKAAEELKRQITEADLYRNNSKYVITEQDLETKERAKHLMKQIDALKMEQEDGVKRFNQVILEAQSQAILDKQIQENKQIKDELAKEEKHLDTLMEVEHGKVVEMTEKADKLRRDQRMKGILELYNQIEERQEERQYEDNVLKIEKMQIRENQKKMILEDREALEKKQLEHQLLQEKIMRINNETMQAKEKRIEEERLADLRDLEFMKKKLEEEAEYDHEQMRIRKEKELELARLRAQQKREKDCQAEQDEIRARKIQEAEAKEWRTKTKEQAANKAHEEVMLRAARQEQVKGKEQCQSMEVDQNRAELERMLKGQREAMVKQKKQEEEQHQKAQLHVQALHQQIRQRELLAAVQHRDFFQDGKRLTEEAQQRRLCFDKFKERRLQELKATGIPEKYYVEVEKKAQKIQLD